MKKVVTLILTSLLLIGLISATGMTASAVDNENELVCCKSYGYGSNMEETNIEYKQIKRKNCAVSENFVGGNKEIVDDSYCQEQNQRRNLTQEQIQEIIKERNRLRNMYQNQSECPLRCECSGSTTRCQFENGTREMAIIAGNSGNIIIQSKKVNASTQVQLYKSEDKIYGTFRNQETKEIKVFPDQIRERIREHIQAELENSEIELDEEGYQIRAEKRVKVLGLFRARAQIQAQVDPETGEITRLKEPWWSFMASDDNSEE